jgi:hypothetical protein
MLPKLLLLLGVAALGAGIAALTRKEAPAMARYLKIARM